MKIPTQQLIIHERTEAFFKATGEIEEFAAAVLNPLLQAILKLSLSESVLIRTYWRMYAWLKSLTKLDSASDYQAVATAARAMFEHLVDFELLRRNQSGLEIRRYFNFEEIEKYRVGKKLVEFRRQNPQFTAHDMIPLTQFMSDPARDTRVQKLKDESWSTIAKSDLFQTHWSGRRLKVRVGELANDYQALYTELYSQLSWHVHAGGVGTDNASLEMFESLIGLAHAHVQLFFLRVVKRLAQVLDLSTAIEGFYLILNELTDSAGVFMLKAQFESLRGRGTGTST